MENDQDIHTVGSQFSTLNVNAVEFVPNFGPCPSFASQVKDVDNITTDEDPPPVKPIVETPENNGNG